MMIKHHIKRSYLIILGIVCSVTMMFCLIQMGDCINRKYKEQAMGTNLYDFRIEGLTKEQAEWIKAELNQEKTEAVGILWGDYGESRVKLEAFQKIEIQLWAGTQEGLEEYGMRLRKGSWSGSPDEVVLEQYVCEMMGIEIGDEVAIHCDQTGDTWQFRLVGIMENTASASAGGWQTACMGVSFEFLYGSGLLAPETEAHTVIVTVISDVDDYTDRNIDKIIDIEDRARNLLAQVHGADRSFTEMFQSVAGGQTSEEEKELVREINQQIGLNYDKNTNSLEYQSQSTAGNALKAVALLIAVAMILLIFNSMHLTIAENTKELGMLRCVGMDYRQTGLIIFTENICYCILGYVGGIVLGNLIDQFAAKKILLYIAGEAVTIRQLASSYLLTAAVVLVSLILAFVLSIHKIVTLTPIEASKYNGVSAGRQKVQPMEKWSCIKFAERNIKRERSKSIIVMLSMIFSMTILMVIVNTMFSVKLPEKDPKSRFSDYEVYLHREGWVAAMEGNTDVGISVSEMEKVRGMTGVEETYAISMNPNPQHSMYRRQNGDRIPVILYNDAMFQWLLEENGEMALGEEAPDSVCVITGSYTEKEQELLEEIGVTGGISYRLENGDQGAFYVNFVLQTDYLPENKGTGDGSGPVMIILTEKTASEIYGGCSYTDVMIKCNSDAGNGIYAGIAGIFADNEYAICGSYEIGMEKMLTDTLVIIYVALLIVIATALTAILNMMIIMRANLILRRREYGIWRALGMPLKQLKRTISTEILIMLFVSCMIAVVISVPLVFYLCMQMDNFNGKGMIIGYIDVSVVSIAPVYFLVMSGLRFKQTNEIMADIREE
ncbi:MAG: ABC transporter permease [bacterium]|nr:ABC transporter permease [bacterium]